MELTIKETSDSFESWLSRDFVSQDLRETLARASILIVPFEKLRDTANPLLFPTGTEDLLRYFQQNLPQEHLIDICISDKDYQEFVFNSDYKRLGNFLVKNIAIPTFVAVLSAYVYDRYVKEDNTKPQIQIIDHSTRTTINNNISTLADKKYLEPTHVKFSVTVVDTTGASKKISFEGPAKDIDTALKALKEYDK